MLKGIKGGFTYQLKTTLLSIQICISLYSQLIRGYPAIKCGAFVVQFPGLHSTRKVGLKYPGSNVFNIFGVEITFGERAVLIKLIYFCLQNDYKILTTGPM